MRPTDPRLLRRLRPARGALTVVVLANAAAGVCVLAQAVALSHLVLSVVRGGDVGPAVLALLVVLAARALLGTLSDVAAARAAERVGTDLRRQLMARSVQSSSEEDGASGSRAVLLTRGVAAAEPYLTRYVPALVTAAVLPPLTVLFLARTDLLSAVVVLATLPLVPLFGALVGLATRDRARAQWRAMASLAGHFVDVVRGLPTLVAHRRADAQSRVILRVTDDYRRATLATLRVAFASSAVLELVATLSIALVAVLVGTRLAAGDLDLGTGLVVLLLAPEAYWPLRRVGAEFHAAAEGVATFEEVDGLLAEDEGGEPLGTSGCRLTGDLVVEGLGIRYPGRRQQVLEDLDARFAARGLTAVVGPSGCGKTTLLRTLAGLAEPTAGRVLVGGMHVGREELREAVAWVPQRPVVLTGSVRDNLLLADPQADDVRLWRALGDVSLAQRVRRMPGGLDAAVGQDGRLLSAGERARLVLGRVVLSDRPWVLLDEPTAHLDTATERVVLAVLSRLAGTHGVVVVTHRESVLAVADRVVTVPARPTPERTGGTRPGSFLPRIRKASPAAACVAAPPRAPTDPVRRGQLALAGLLGASASLSGMALTVTAGWLIVTAADRPPILTLLVAVVGVRLFGLARPVLRYAERLVSHDAVLRRLARRRAEVYDVLVPLTPGRLGRRRGDLLAAVVDDVDEVTEAELRVRQPLVTAAVVLLASAVTAWLLLPSAAVPVLTLGAVVATTTTAGAFASRRVATGVAAGRGALSAAAVEVLQAKEELLAWGADQRATDRVAVLSRELGGLRVRAATLVGASRAVVLVACGAAVAAIAALAAAAVERGQLEPAVAAGLVLVPVALAEVLVPVADAGALAASSNAAASRLRALSHTAPAVTPNATAPAVLTADGDVALVRASAGWESDVLRDLDLHLAPGAALGVVGPSGCGKSTLAALLMRFLDPSQGHVALDDRRLDSMRLDDVRRHVGLVDDDPHVFASSVVENVRLARPGASDARVEDALRRARLGPWLDGLEEGLHSVLGDGGCPISGGERARLGLARALLADPAVLVLDEPTAHLDPSTAEEVTADLLDAREGHRTLVLVTHTRHGLDRVDQVLDLGEGAGTSVHRREVVLPAGR